MGVVMDCSAGESRRRRAVPGAASLKGAIAATAWLLLSAAGVPGTAEAIAPRPASGDTVRPPVTVAPEPDEVRFRDLEMLTFHGQNAEAYFSADGERLIFQRSAPGAATCDQIYVMDADGGHRQRVSDGTGRTTCGYFFPSGERVVYSSTRAQGPECPPAPDYSGGYVWALHEYDIYTARPDGSDRERLVASPGYDAEATLSPDGRRIVFTSVRDGDLEIYVMDADGTDVRRLTHEPGYDGGPFFSSDGRRIVYRAHHPADSAGLAEYRDLLDRGLVRPSVMEIYVMNADGSGKRQLTENGAANFAPFFHPDGERIIFSSNMHDPDSRNFDLYLIRIDGTGLERVTTHPAFDGFPMFSRDGARLVFASNRRNRRPGDTNVFVADWVEEVDVGARERGTQR